MRPAEKRLAEFKAGSGRYLAKPKRPYAQPEAIVALKKQHCDAMNNLRHSRDEWRRRAEAGPSEVMRKRLALLERVVAKVQDVATALTHVGQVSANKGVRFAARKLTGALAALDEVER